MRHTLHIYGRFNKIQREYMNQHRIYRVLKLIELLKEKPRHIRTISRYLQISERSVYRYINCFKEVGLNVYRDKNLKYGIEKLWTTDLNTSN
jgi:predicted DNA-binding transcriptional regulator YafY